MKKDEAVSVVVALMLVLAILCTVIAIYTTTYLPGLKQQDEIIHNNDVKIAFERTASDINNLIAFGTEREFQETLVLGGGDIVLSPGKSSGYLSVSQSEPVRKYTLYIDGTAYSFDFPQTVITYTPQFTSWEKQGYQYQDGTVWIFKNSFNDKRTPASSGRYSLSDGRDEEKSYLNMVMKSVHTGTIQKSDGTFVSALVIPDVFADTVKSEASGSGSAKINVSASYDFDLISVPVPAGKKYSIEDENGNVMYDERTAADDLYPVILKIMVSVE